MTQNEVVKATAKNVDEMTRDELREVAREMSIAGRGSMTKAQLLEAVKERVAEQEEAHDDEKEYCEAGAAVEVAEPAGDAENKLPEVDSKKMKYIETAEVGMTVAFKTPWGKVKSARIAKRSTSRRMFLLVTKYGQEFKVPFESILWVKVSPEKRWPAYIIKMFKSNVEGGTNEQKGKGGESGLKA